MDPPTPHLTFRGHSAGMRTTSTNTEERAFRRAGLAIIADDVAPQHLTWPSAVTPQLWRGAGEKATPDDFHQH